MTRVMEDKPLVSCTFSQGEAMTFVCTLLVRWQFIHITPCCLIENQIIPVYLPQTANTPVTLSDPSPSVLLTSLPDCMA